MSTPLLIHQRLCQRLSPESGRAPRAGETISGPRFHTLGSLTISGNGRHQNTSRNSVNTRFQCSVDGLDTVGSTTRNERASAMLNPPNSSGSSCSVSSANVTSPGGCRTTWRSSSRISSASSSLSNSRIRSWMPLVIGRSCATITSRRFHLAELRPAMAMSSICSSTNSRKRRTSFLSILMLATERKNRSNTGIPDGWVTRYLRSIDLAGPTGPILNVGISSVTANRTRRCNLARPIRPNRSMDTREHTEAEYATGGHYHPQVLSRYWQHAVNSAGLRPIKLHAARRSAVTAMHLAGTPVAVIAAWIGHKDASLTMKLYPHSQDYALKAAGATRLTRA